MNTRLALCLALALVAAGSVACANAPVADRAETKPYTYWLHPKLGMIKVDRQTNEMPVKGSAR